MRLALWLDCYQKIYKNLIDNARKTEENKTRIIIYGQGLFESGKNCTG